MHACRVSRFFVHEGITDRILDQPDRVSCRQVGLGLHPLVHLLGEPVLALEAVLDPGQPPLRILGLDPLHGRRDGIALDLPDPIVGLVDRMSPDHGVHPGAVRLVLPGRGGGHRPHPARVTRVHRSARIASLVRMRRVSAVARPAVGPVRLVDPHRCHPMSRSNLGHSPKTTTGPATRFTPAAGGSLLPTQLRR